jgi:hypothetical protein
VIFDEEGEERLKGQVPHLGGAQGFVNGGMGGAIAFHFILKSSLWRFLEVFLVLLDGCPELWEEELLKGDLVLTSLVALVVQRHGWNNRRNAFQILQIWQQTALIAYVAMKANTSGEQVVQKVRRALQRLNEEDEGLQKPCDSCCGRDSHNESESQLEERAIKVRFPRSATRNSHDQK